MHRAIHAFLIALSITGLSVNAAETTSAKDPLVIVVMDPLAKPLSCPCVAGYAQRDYEQLADRLTKSLSREVKVVFNESLVAALKNDGIKQAQLVIGKQSVILHDAKAAGLKLERIGLLSGKDGLVTQRGLFVVPSADPAKKVADLKGYQIVFGTAECDEKHDAALRLLQESGVERPAKLDTAVACDEGAVKILELATQNKRGCAVISSYAKPLLEGCGQVPKGALRVIGETEEVPFVAAYINSALDAEQRAEISAAVLRSMTNDFALRTALESKRGFVAADEVADKVAKKK